MSFSWPNWSYCFFCGRRYEAGCVQGDCGCRFREKLGLRDEQRDKLEEIAKIINKQIKYETEIKKLKVTIVMLERALERKNDFWTCDRKIYAEKINQYRNALQLFLDEHCETTLEAAKRAGLDRITLSVLVQHYEQAINVLRGCYDPRPRNRLR